MNYLQKKFNGPNPSNLNGVTCEACVYGERWAFHHERCPKRDIHREAAARALEIPLSKVTDDQRRAAKVVNYALNFGGGPQLTPGQSVEEFCDLYGKFA